MSYMWNIATAASLSIGKSKTADLASKSWLTGDETITVAEALANPRDAQTRLIGSNMMALQSYVNLLKTDIPTLLDESGDEQHHSMNI